MLNGSSTEATPVRMHHEKCVAVFRARLGVEPKQPPEKRPQVLIIEQGTLELLNRQDRAAILDCIGRGMGCVVLLGPIHNREHPGAVVTPKIRDLISAAEKLPPTRDADSPSHGRVITALNVEQHPAWGRGTAGIETVYSDMLQAVYRSIGKRPGARQQVRLDGPGGFVDVHAARHRRNRWPTCRWTAGRLPPAARSVDAGLRRVAGR